MAQRIAEADQLIALNASAITTNTPQQYQQAVNGIYLNTLAKGNLSLSQPEISQLSAIANTCLYEYGPAVSGARNLLVISNGYQVYDDDLLCSPPVAFVSNNNISSNPILTEVNEILLLPNPAKDRIEVRFPMIENLGQINMFDTKGVLKFSSDLRQGEDRHTIILSGLTSGIYLVTVKTSNQALAKKLIVLE